MPSESSTERAEALVIWVAQALGEPVVLAPASSDASFRRYFRLVLASGETRILMDAPPSHEAILPWLEVQRRFEQAGLAVPQVHAFDQALGVVLMQDLGERLLLQTFETASAIDPYAAALASLLRLQGRVSTSGLPSYSASLLQQELRLFPEWLLERHLGLPLTGSDQQHWQDLVDLLVGSALAQPQVCVHRDYHSRNLTPLDPPQQGVGVLDFQDAVVGPITYDLVSLLRDCYWAWPDEAVDAWSLRYHASLVEAGLPGAPTEAIWQRWFDWMGVQRHLKAAGIFCRLWHRDGKKAYLADVPRVLAHIEEESAGYPELEWLLWFIETHVRPAWRRRAEAPAPST